MVSVQERSLTMTAGDQWQFAVCSGRSPLVGLPPGPIPRHVEVVPALQVRLLVGHHRAELLPRQFPERVCGHRWSRQPRGWIFEGFSSV